MPQYHNNRLFIDRVAVDILAAEFGTPLYVYDAESIRRCCRELKTAFVTLAPHIHYSVKANSNLSILKILLEENIGFDVVSGGELARLQAIQGSGDLRVLPEDLMREVSFAGVGKTAAEISLAIQAGIGFFNVESEGELARLAGLAQEYQTSVQVLLRLNPDVDAQSHHYITTGKSINKFGLALDRAAGLCDAFMNHSFLRIVGVHLHTGSQIKEIQPYLEAAQKALDFIERRQAKGQKMSWLNLGGGYGIAYQDEGRFPLKALADALTERLASTGLKIILEPGRSIVGPAGVLLTQVQYIKETMDKRFIIVDSGMHHLIRPALYEGWHEIWPANQDKSAANLSRSDIVGPICESADFLAKDRNLPPVREGEILAVFNAGAYGFAMASNYNTQPRPAEVLVDGDNYRLIRSRETYQDLFRAELPALNRF